MSTSYPLIKEAKKNLPFTTISYLNDKGNLSENFHFPHPIDVILKAYKVMSITRCVDERMITLQRQGLISFALSSLGEEACAVGSAAALDPTDWMYPQYREVGVMFWRGFTIREYIQHMFCNAEDLVLGRQMPNHFGSRKLNVVQVSSPIGTKIPHAAGCAYAMKLKKEQAVAICFFGEGASSEGDFHVGLNFAAVRKAPAIFFCRNNGYAISTPCERQFASEGIAPKGVGYGMPAIRVDGNDFFAVYEVVRQAKEYALAGNGPVLIEAMTYRLGAHSTADDPSLYRTEAEAQSWQVKCPIARLRMFLEAKGAWDEAQQHKMVLEIQREIDEAIEIAKKTPNPPLRSLIEHVYFEIPQFLKEELEEVERGDNGST